MEYKNGQIHFDKGEQRRFDVDPVVSPESACQTAQEFHRLAPHLDDISIAIRCEEDPRSQHDGVVIAHRAVALEQFAKNIEEKCPGVMKRVRRQALEAYKSEHPDNF